MLTVVNKSPVYRFGSSLEPFSEDFVELFTS